MLERSSASTREYARAVEERLIDQRRIAGLVGDAHVTRARHVCSNPLDEVVDLAPRDGPIEGNAHVCTRRDA